MKFFSLRYTEKNKKISHKNNFNIIREQHGDSSRFVINKRVKLISS